MVLNNRVQYLAAFAVSLATMTASTAYFWTAPILPKFHNNETSITITNSEISWVVAMMAPGVVTGSLVASGISDRFGRRITLLGSAVPFIVGTLFVLWAMKPWMLYIARYLWGGGAGMINTVSSVYLSEIADNDIRGTLTAGTRFMFSFGALLVLAVGSFVSYQVLSCFLIVLPICYFTACLKIPETPYYLLKEGKVDDARKELLKLCRKNDPKTVEEKLSLMRSDVRKEMLRSGSVKELLTGKQYRKAVIVTTGLKVTQIMAGSIPIQQYLGRIIQQSNCGLEVSTALIIFGAVRFAVVSIAAVLGGVSFSWPAPVLAKLHNNETDINITDEQISWLAAISSPGYMTGSLATRFIADRFGKRTTILGSALPVITGTIIVLSTTTVWGLYMARLLWGIGTGMLGTVSSVYLAEVSDKKIRGTVTAAIRFMFSFGSFLVMAIGPFVSYQTLSYMLLVLPICYFISCSFIPETPYYYLKEGRVDDARNSLKKLSGNKDEAALEEKLSAMRADVGKEMRRAGSLKELMVGKRYRKAVIIAIGLRLTTNMAGSTALQRYLGRIAQDTASNMNISTVLIIFGAVRFIVGIFSSAIVDKVGRRPLLFYTFLSSSICLALAATYYLIQPLNSIYTFIPFVGIILSNILSTLGYETLSFVIPAEIFPLNVKSVAMTFVNIFGGLLNFLSVKGYQQLKHVGGLAGVFWFYATSSMIGAVFTYFVVIETKERRERA